MRNHKTSSTSQVCGAQVAIEVIGQGPSQAQYQQIKLALTRAAWSTCGRVKAISIRDRPSGVPDRHPDQRLHPLPGVLAEGQNDLLRRLQAGDRGNAACPLQDLNYRLDLRGPSERNFCVPSNLGHYRAATLTHGCRFSHHLAR